jgi:diguanylate cyclase (GGDEF)-like protein
MHAAQAEADPGVEVLPGECAGAFSVLGGERRGVHISATQDSELLAIDADGLWKLIDEASGFARKLLALRSAAASAGHPSAEPDAQAGAPSIADSGIGMRNRVWLDQHLTGMAQRADESGLPFSMLLISLDYVPHFIEAYDEFAVKDGLRVTASVILDSLRPTDFAARYSDYELAVLLPDVHADGAAVVAQRLSETLKKTVVFADMREPLPHVTASFGVACLGAGQNERDLLAAAAVALERAQKIGNGGVSA